MFETRHSAHFGAFVNFSIDKGICLGCKGSWVQIPPRRPLYQYLTSKNTLQPQSGLLDFPLANFNSLGANSAQNKKPAGAGLFQSSAHLAREKSQEYVKRNAEAPWDGSPTSYTSVPFLSPGGLHFLRVMARYATSAHTVKQDQYLPSGDGFNSSMEWGNNGAAQRRD